MAVALRAGIIVIATVLRLGERGRLWLRRGRRIPAGTLDDLVEFASIKPDAAALRTVIDLDTLAFAHHERDAAGRADQTREGRCHMGLQTKKE